MRSHKVITADFLIIGGGIIGLCVAIYLKKIFSDSKVVLLEKEKQCGFHASGRNSGVLHAGFYYTPDSLKAKFTRLGNRVLTEYCEQKKIPIHKCGKLVVAKDFEDLATLNELLQRGRENGVVLEELTSEEAQKIEPRIKTFQKALFSPTTSSVNPVVVVKSIAEDAKNEGVEIHYGVKFLKKKANHFLLTSGGKYQAKYVVNASGLYADKIARDFHFSEYFRILPFKGIYLYSNEEPFSLHTHVYPVPDLKNPFLGVHFTVTMDGRMKIGPTAIPAFWREQYGAFEHFKINEFIEILMRQLGLLMFSHFDFKKLVMKEIKKYSRAHLVQIARSMVDIKKEDFKKIGKSGIRAQLLNIKERKLEMDFVLEGDESSMHILNAVSPAFTSSFPFAQYVCEKIKALVC